MPGSVIILVYYLMCHLHVLTDPPCKKRRLRDHKSRKEHECFWNRGKLSKGGGRYGPILRARLTYYTHESHYFRRSSTSKVDMKDDHCVVHIFLVVCTCVLLYRLSSTYFLQHATSCDNHIIIITTTGNNSNAL